MNTIIVSVPSSQTSYGASSYLNQEIITLDTGMLFVNKDNDDVIVWDFFTGNYYDSAYGIFDFFITESERVRVSDQSSLDCLNNTTHDGYQLEGYSYNSDFGTMNFNDTSSNTYVYLCVPKDATDEDLYSYLWWYAYSSNIWLQNFDGIQFDTSVDENQSETRWWNHLANSRYIKIDGITSSVNYEAVDALSESEVRLVWNIAKSDMRVEFSRNVYGAIRNISPDNRLQNVNSAGVEHWNTQNGWVALRNDSILFFWDLDWSNVSLSWTENIEWSKTLVVEGWNIYITQNLRNTDNDNSLLGLVALEKDGQWWNIYIDPSVTDIHAIMYADRALLNYNWVEIIDSQEWNNQLYVKGSIFSENTIGWLESTTCPYFENTSCTSDIAKKYDFNHFRNYILVSELSTQWELTGQFTPQFWWAESYLWDNDRTNTEIQKPWYRKYSFIIEYNPMVQDSPPPLF